MVMEGIGGRKLAATVLLVRDTPLGVEVFVQERVAEMPTFPNTTVFPGGGVDARDLEDGSGVDSDLWAEMLDVTPRHAHGLVLAAIRECFEETGVLLARKEGELLTDTKEYESSRAALENHELSFTAFLAQEGLEAAPDMLRPFARWVGPVWATKQFDTFSFVAKVPFGQACHVETREASSTGWFLPSVILGGWKMGLLRLVVPTWSLLKALSEFSTTDELLESLENPDMSPMIGEPKDNPWFAEFYAHANQPERF